MLVPLSSPFRMERKDSVATSSKLPSNTSSNINKLQLREFFNCATARHANNNDKSIFRFSPSLKLSYVKMSR